MILYMKSNDVRYEIIIICHRRPLLLHGHPLFGTTHRSTDIEERVPLLADDALSERKPLVLQLHLGSPEVRLEEG